LTLLTVSNELTKNNTLEYLDSEVCVCAFDLDTFEFYIGFR